jgi:hypothetical protein
MLSTGTILAVGARKAEISLVVDGEMAVGWDCIWGTSLAALAFEHHRDLSGRRKEAPR